MSKTEKRKRGRPPGVRYPITKHVFLSQTMAGWLHGLAEHAGQSESAFMRHLIEEAMGEHYWTLMEQKKYQD